VTLPSTVSIVIASVDAVVALVTARISLGPGWRSLAPFSFVAALAAVFAGCDTVFTLSMAPSAYANASRIGLFVAGLHGAGWFVYGAAQQARALTRFERAMIITGIVVGVVSLVPGAFVTDVIYARPVPWLGVVYHDAYTTRAGEACYTLYAFGLAVLAWRYFVQWREKTPGALAHFIGVFVLLATGINDALSASRVYDGPYLLDVGFLLAVACVGFVHTSRFVDSARVLEEQTVELRKTQAELVRRERLAALGELSAIVAHEVRTPVSVVFNALSMLRREELSANATALLGIVDEEANRLRRMIDDLIAFARPEMIQPRATNAHALMEDAVDAARAASEARTAVDIAVDDEARVIHCDERLVREAVINLVTNALQASRGAEPVRVAVKREGENVRIAVTDDGAGIPPDVLPKLFTPFFTTRARGTGLGLAIVKRIAEAHGGEAVVARPEGPGTTFVLVLPSHD